ncbi:tetratricopeptide repeat protein [Candidatus Berkiella aquae]|uniref:Localization factor PodJL n=1 Tax=Candidatus Berkiella aquae TaxID=295108 RepID=A0A0Q9YUS8_9GAMM|nr:tetratricopeptide repeat protein [Candidatus Berkiella aquae]MCS5710719.1 sel1 repeat family protein [Candidatus Berkiella aquae]
MHFKQLGSLLLLAWPMLSVGNDGENYSAETGFKRKLPLTQAAHQTTIAINRTQEKALEKLKESTTLENYSATTGFKRSLPVAPKINHQLTPMQKTITDSKPSAPEKRKQRVAKKKKYTLLTKRQIQKENAKTQKVQQDKNNEHNKNELHAKNVKSQKIQTANHAQSGKSMSSLIAELFKAKPNTAKNNVSTKQSLEHKVITNAKTVDPAIFAKKCADLYNKHQYTKALKACEKAAENHDHASQLALAKMYSIGSDSAAPDYVKSLHYATLAANQNNPEAQFFMALCFENGIGVSKDTKAAHRWYQRAVNNGLPNAKSISAASSTVNLEKMFWPGATEYQNALKELKKADTHKKGIESLQLAAEHGHPLAEYQLAMQYLQGNDIAQDDAKALHWLSKSAEKDNHQAQSYLAWMSFLGLGAQANTQVALNWFIAAKQPHDENDIQDSLQNKLAQLSSVPVRTQISDKKQQIANFQRGIDLIEMSENGSAEGIALVTKAAEQNNIDAQLYLARLYEQGEKAPANSKMIFKWYEQAAIAGNADAQYALGWLYYHGQGVSKDSELAAQWFAKANRSGDTRANEAIAFLDSQSAKETAMTMPANLTPAKPTIASRVKDKITDNMKGIVKALGLSGLKGYSRHS